MAHPFKTAIVQIDMRQFNILLVQTVNIQGETMVLRGDLYMAGGQLFHRLIAAAMAEFQLVGGTAIGKPQDLMAQTYAKDRRLPQ